MPGTPTISRRAASSPQPRAGRTLPFSAEDAERAVVDAAVDVLKLRGEPVSFDGLLGEILVGLDRTGHLRRLVRPPAPPEGEPPAEPARDTDHVDRLLTLVRSALAGADGRRLVKVGDDRWWLGDKADREVAAVPLADRVEWAVYSLLSTAGPLSEPAFLDRVAGLFTGPDLPDEALVRACLDSYRSHSSTSGRLHNLRRPRPAQRGAQPADRGSRQYRSPPWVLVLGG